MHKHTNDGALGDVYLQGCAGGQGVSRCSLGCCHQLAEGVPRGLRGQGGFCCHADCHQHQRDNGLRSGWKKQQQEEQQRCECGSEGETKELSYSTAGSSIALALLHPFQLATHASITLATAEHVHEVAALLAKPRIALPWLPYRLGVLMYGESEFTRGVHQSYRRRPL